ncbi:TPA: type VI secretion system baseplate subunit TssF [Klebsiella variicola subsp. variicola]|uniref:type VI secretion system baseplate subunit TssF n=1 Tax=Klebsiella TaxID=570 RepID=UPI000DDB83EB|nr:type VI secretion system baseplate subunit TssF [Klebsiella variicola]
MDDLTLRYYEAEMRYLREAGKEFARAHPDRAAMLNLDKPGARDPYVERLFEGFAFLMGRLREKLDDDLPELTEGLVSLLWPHYMRTIPSLAIVEFSPDWRSLRQAEMLAEGFSVLSRPVGPHKTACQYRTTRDVSLQPLQLAEARLHTETDGRSAIRLRFECPEKVDWRKAGIDKVAIFLNAESPVSSALHLAMTRRVHAMYARHAGTHTERHQFNGWCKPMGFDDNDGLWKKADTAFSGYQLLLEYFSFRPKFMFVELRGLDTIGLTAASTWFEIDMVLSEAWSQMFEQRLKPLNEAVLFSAPEGMALTSGEHLQMTATKNVAINAGEDINAGVMGNMTALAGEKLGLFARTGQLSLKSGEGPVEVQAQNASLRLFAEKKLTLSSASDISFAGKKRITLIGGGSYLRLEAGKVEYGTTATYIRKVKRTMFAGANSTPTPSISMPLVDDLIRNGFFDEQFRILDDSGKPMANVPYFISSENGETFKGVTDNQGLCKRVFSKESAKLTVWLGVLALERW